MLARTTLLSRNLYKCWASLKLKLNEIKNLVRLSRIIKLKVQQHQINNFYHFKTQFLQNFNRIIFFVFSSSCKKVADSKPYFLKFDKKLSSGSKTKKKHTSREFFCAKHFFEGSWLRVVDVFIVIAQLPGQFVHYFLENYRVNVLAEHVEQEPVAHLGLLDDDVDALLLD